MQLQQAPASEPEHRAHMWLWVQAGALLPPLSDLCFSLPPWLVLALPTLPVTEITTWNLLGWGKRLKAFSRPQLLLGLQGEVASVLGRLGGQG